MPMYVLKRYLPFVLIALVVASASILGSHLLAMNNGNGRSPESSVTPQSEISSPPGFVIPEITRIKICPFDQGLSVVRSSHKYVFSGPQRIEVYAKRGDRVEITLKVELNPDLVRCIRDTLNISSELNVEYGLSLEPQAGTVIVIIPGASRLSTSSIELIREGDLYKLLITIDEGVEKGLYYITLYAWIKITGENADISGATEYTVFLVVD